MRHMYVNTGAISTKIDTQLSCRIVIQKGKGGGIAINLLVAPQKKKQKVEPTDFVRVFTILLHLAGVQMIARRAERLGQRNAIDGTERENFIRHHGVER